MCCVCNVSCNHVGNHSFCEAHGGTPALGRVATTTGTGMWTYASFLSEQDIERIAKRVAELLREERVS